MSVTKENTTQYKPIEKYKKKKKLLLRSNVLQIKTMAVLYN